MKFNVSAGYFFLIFLICLTFNLQAQTSGDLDSTFNLTGRVRTVFVGVDGKANAVLIQSDGKILVAGSDYNGTDYDFAVSRYTSVGALDTTFGNGGKVVVSIGNGDDLVFTAALQSDGKIIVGGESFNGTNDDFAVARFNADGSLDTSFDGDGKTLVDFGAGDNGIAKIILQTDGKILAAGYASNGANDDFAIARFNGDGSLDTSFDGDGYLTTAIGISDDYANALGVQTDGKIVAAGKAYVSSDDFAVARFNADGTPDTSFDGDGKLTTNIGGAYDAAQGLAIQSNGKIVAVGETFNGTNGDFSVVRYNADGTLDTSFDGDGKTTFTFGSGYEYALAATLQADGKIIVAGTAEIGASTDFAIARLTASGALDSAFSGDGKQTVDFGGTNDYGNSAVIDNLGRIVAAGQADNGFGVIRLTYSLLTAANASLSGKVLTTTGKGVANAKVTLTDENGTTRAVRTNAFGNYRFENIQAGKTYVVKVESKRFVYRDQAVTINESLAGFDFYPKSKSEQ